MTRGAMLRQVPRSSTGRSFFIQSSLSRGNSTRGLGSRGLVVCTSDVDSVDSLEFSFGHHLLGAKYETPTWVSRGFGVFNKWFLNVCYG